MQRETLIIKSTQKERSARNLCKKNGDYYDQASEFHSRILRFTKLELLAGRGKGYLTMRMSLKRLMPAPSMCRRGTRTASRFIRFFPVKAPEEKRGAVAAFLTRANYGLILGSFELDFDDGEIRFKVTAICGEQVLSPAVMERNFDMGFCMFDRYGEGLLKGPCTVTPIRSKWWTPSSGETETRTGKAKHR